MKQNDYLALNLNLKDSNIDPSNLRMYGITPQNTGLQDKDYYKTIPQVIDTFTKNGKFDDVAFDAFYDSVERSYSNFASNDYLENLINSIPVSSDDIFSLGNTNIYDDSAKIVRSKDPNRHAVGISNLFRTGKPSFSEREVAQTNKVRDTEGNVLDWSPNDKRFLKALFRPALALATYEEGETSIENGIEVVHHKGEHKYDPITGDPFYEILGDKEIYGRDVLHFSDTLTREGTFWNKLDIFDSDGIETSIKKTLARTAVEIAAYMAAGPYLGALEAARALSKTIPAVTKAVNSMITNDSDNTVGKTMTSLENWAAQFDRSQSDKGKGKFWSFENIGNQLIDSAKQLYSQGLIRKIPYLLKQHPSIKSQKLGALAATLYMATTSAEDVYGDYKLAGVSDRFAGIGALATMGAFFSFMNNDYFKQYLFNDPILELPELRKTLKGQARVMGNAYRQRVAEIASKAGAKFEVKEAQRLALSEGAKWYNKVYNAVAGVINKIPEGFITDNAFLVRGFNEGFEEVLEEGATDLIKGLELGLNELGWDIKDKDASTIDFGYSPEDFLQRYSTSLIGGFMGGMVFEGLNRWDNRKIKSISSLDLDSQLSWYIRNGYTSEILKTIDGWEKKGKFGSKELSMKYKIESDGENKKIIWEPGNDTENQNSGIANILRQRVKELDAQLKTLGIQMMMSDIEILRGAVSENKALMKAEEAIKQEAKKAGKSLNEYKEQNLRDARIDFIKQVGIDKLILSDAADFQYHIMFLANEIEKRKAELLNVPDEQRSEAEKAVEQDKVLKTYEKDLKDTQNALDEILSGKRTNEYLALALFAGDDVLKNIYLSEIPSNLEDERKTTYFEDFKHWIRTRYGLSYDELVKNSGEKDPNTGKTLFESYLESNFTQWYNAKEDVSRIRGAYELHKNFSETINPILSKQISSYNGYKKEEGRSGMVMYNYEESVKALKELVEAKKNLQKYITDHPDSTLESDLTLKSLADVYNAALQGYYYVSPQRILDDKFYEDDKVNPTKNALDNLVELVEDDDVDKIFDFIKSYYQALNSNKIVSEFSDDIFEIGISSAIHSYIQNNLSKIRERGSNMVFDIVDAIKNTISKMQEQLQLIPEDDLQEFSDRLAKVEILMDLFDRDGDIEHLYDETGKSVIEDLFELASDFELDSNSIELQQSRLTLLHGDFLGKLIDKIDNLANEFDKSVENGITEYGNIMNWYNSVESANDIFGTAEDIIGKLIFEGNDIVSKINEIKQVRSLGIPTPILDWIDALSMDLTGGKLRIWELLKEESQNLRNQDDITEYVINNPSSVSELEFIGYALTACEGVLRGAVAGGANGYINALNETGELLPTLGENKELADVYLHDINIIRQRVATLLDIHQRNHKSTIQLKRESFINNAPKFLNNIVKQVTGEPNLLQTKFKDILGVDIVTIWNDINKDELDLEQIDDSNFDDFWQKFRLFMDELYKQCRSIDVSESFKKATEEAGYTINNINDLFAYVLTSSYTDLWKYQNSDINASKDSIVTALDTVLVLTSIIGNNPSNSFKAMQYASEKTGRTPFWDQMLAILIGHSKKHASDLFNSVLTAISNKGKNEIMSGNFEESARGYLLDRPLIKNAISIDGASGTGKTDIVLRFIKIMSEVDTRKDSSDNDFTVKSYAVAKYEFRTNALGNVLGITGDNKMLLSALFEKYFGEVSDSDFGREHGHHRRLTNEAIDKFRQKLQKDGIGLEANEILDIYIDESGLLSEGDLQLLSLLTEFGKVNLIFAGDSMQTGWTGVVESNGRQIPVNSGLLDVQILPTPRLTTSLRANNYGMQYNLEQMETKIGKLFDEYKEKPWIYLSELVDSYKFVPINAEVNNDLFGISIISDATTLIERLQKSGKTIGIITDTPDKYNRFTSDSIEVIDPINAQGNEYDYTIIDIKNIPNLSDFDKDRYQYTLLSRARNGSYVVNSLGDINSSKSRIDASTPINERNEDGEIESDDLNEYKSWWKNLFRNDIFDKKVEESPQIVPQPIVSNPAGQQSGPVAGGLNTGYKEVSVYKRENFNVEKFKEDVKDQGSDVKISSYTKTKQRISDLDNYKKYYQAIRLHGSDGTLLDLKTFVDWLFDTLKEDDPILTDEKFGIIGNNKYSDQEILKIKRFIRDFAYDLIQLNVDELKEKYATLTETIKSNIKDRVFVDSFLKQIENLSNKPIYAVRSGNDSYLYFIVTGKLESGEIKHWAIPISIIKGSTVDGWFNLNAKQIVPLVMLSSAGNTQEDLNAVAGNYVDVSENGYVIKSLADELDIAQGKAGDELKRFINRTSGHTNKIVSSIFNHIVVHDVLKRKLDQDGKIIRLDQTELEGNTRLTTVNRRIDVQTYFDIAKLILDLRNNKNDAEKNNKLMQFFDETDIIKIQTSDDAEKIKALRKCSIISTNNRNKLVTALLRWFWNDGVNKRDGWTHFIEEFYNWATNKRGMNVKGKSVQRGLSFTFYQENGLPKSYAVLYDDDGKFKVYDGLTDEKLDGELNSKDWFGTTDFDLIKAVTNLINLLTANNQGISIDNIEDLLKSGDISIGLITRHETPINKPNGNTEYKISYYAPFDSDIYKLVPEKTILDANFEKFLQEDSVFKYGFLIGYKGGDADNLADFLTVSNPENGKTDIIEIIPPLFEFNVSGIDTSGLPNDLGTLSHSIETSNKSEVTVEIKKDVSGKTIGYHFQQNFEINGLELGLSSNEMFYIKDIVERNGNFELIYTDVYNNSYSTLVTPDIINNIITGMNQIISQQQFEAKGNGDYLVLNKNVYSIIDNEGGKHTGLFILSYDGNIVTIEDKDENIYSLNIDPDKFEKFKSSVRNLHIDEFNFFGINGSGIAQEYVYYNPYTKQLVIKQLDGKIVTRGTVSEIKNNDNSVEVSFTDKQQSLTFNIEDSSEELFENLKKNAFNSIKQKTAEQIIRDEIKHKFKNSEYSKINADPNKWLRENAILCGNLYEFKDGKLITSNNLELQYKTAISLSEILGLDSQTILNQLSDFEYDSDINVVKCVVNGDVYIFAVSKNGNNWVLQQVNDQSDDLVEEYKAWYNNLPEDFIKASIKTVLESFKYDTESDAISEAWQTLSENGQNPDVQRFFEYQGMLDNNQMCTVL